MERHRSDFRADAIDRLLFAGALTGLLMLFLAVLSFPS
jgi:hypothetical protein